MRLATAIALCLLAITFAAGWIWGYLFAHGSGALTVVAFLHFLPAMAVQGFLEAPSLSSFLLVLGLLSFEFVYFLLVVVVCLWLFKRPLQSHVSL